MDLDPRQEAEASTQSMENTVKAQAKQNTDEGHKSDENYDMVINSAVSEPEITRGTNFAESESGGRSLDNLNTQSNSSVHSSSCMSESLAIDIRTEINSLMLLDRRKLTCLQIMERICKVVPSRLRNGKQSNPEVLIGTEAYIKHLEKQNRHLKDLNNCLNEAYDDMIFKRDVLQVLLAFVVTASILFHFGKS